MSLSTRTISLLAIALGVVLFVAANLAASIWLRPVKLDLTQGGLFSISEGTVRTLRAIPEPVTLRFYFSERIASRYPTIRAYGARVRDLLLEYVALSDGRLKLETIDPEPLSAAEDEAVAQGVRGAPIQKGERIYFGLVGNNTADGREVIPLFSEDREQFLEYDLTALVHRLSRDKKPAIGVVTNLPLDSGMGGMEAAMRGQSEPFIIFEQLRSEYEVRFLEQDFEAVPKDIEVVLVIHPKPLNDRTLYALDQFVMRGGRMLAFLDPASELGRMEQSRFNNPKATVASAESLGPLLKSWGVEIDPKFIVGDRERAQRVRSGPGGENVSDYVAWLALKKDDMSQSDRVTQGFQDLNLGTVGAISLLEDRTTTVTPIIRSSKDAAEIPIAKVANDPDPDELLRTFVRSGEQYNIAVRISGPVKSAFPGGKPGGAPKPAEPKPGEAQKPADTVAEHLKESKGPANIILMADADIFTDSFWVAVQEIAGQRIAQPVAANAFLVLNAVEDLGGSNDLISLRARGKGLRPFTAVERIQRSAEQGWLREKQRLEQELQTSVDRLAELEGRREDGGRADISSQQTLTPEQKAEIEQFRMKSAQTRRELRDVQLRLTQDIDRLKSWLAAFNMLFVPFLMIAGLILWSVLRRAPATPVAAKPVVKTGGAS